MSKITLEELLFNDEPITINRKLAKCLGLKEAVIFQQIHYWLKINEKKNQNLKNGKYWTYNSIKKWHQEEFDFLSIRTVERTLQKLEKDGLLISNVFNKMRGDKTKWYTINYNKLLEVCEKKLSEKQELSIKRSHAGKKGALAKKVKSDDTMQPTWQNGGACNQLGSTIQPTWQNDSAKLAEPIPEITTKTSTEITISSSSIENLFETNICTLRKTTRPKFLKKVEDHGEKFIEAVIEECTISDTQFYSGFESALNSYIKRNCKKAEDVHNVARKFREDKKKKGKTINKIIVNNNKKVDSFNNYDQRNYDFEKLEKALQGDKNITLQDCTITENVAVDNPIVADLKNIGLA